VNILSLSDQCHSESNGFFFLLPMGLWRNWEGLTLQGPVGAKNTVCQITTQMTLTWSRVCLACQSVHSTVCASPKRVICNPPPSSPPHTCVSKQEQSEAGLDLLYLALS
jgi:hypothetical protein